MVILFSANTDGAMLQIVVQIMIALDKMNVNCRSFIPLGSKVSIPERLQKQVHYYSKPKSIVIDRRVKEIRDSIMSFKPEFIWYIDAAILDLQLVVSLKHKVKQFLTIHDVEEHPSNKNSLKSRMKNVYYKNLLKQAYQEVDNIILMSEESLKKFIKKKDQFATKAIAVNLCAHIPDVDEMIPSEAMSLPTPFLLFFGRIDKYKGIATLLKAYTQIKCPKTALVIAGKGVFTEEERQLLITDDHVCLINRYIDDGEMKWLFRHACCAVLPYVEASQSGIIPVAYKFGKPVLVSNVPGLTQVVADGETGYICNDVTEFKEKMEYISRHYLEFSEACSKYYNEKMNWDRVLKDFMNSQGYPIE